MIVGGADSHYMEHVINLCPLRSFFEGLYGFHIVSEAERSGIVLSLSDQVTWALKLLATL